jgi:hypothetical protein
MDAIQFLAMRFSSSPYRPLIEKLKIFLSFQSGARSPGNGQRQPLSAEIEGESPIWGIPKGMIWLIIMKSGFKFQ